MENDFQTRIAKLEATAKELQIELFAAQRLTEQGYIILQVMYRDLVKPKAVKKSKKINKDK